MFKSTLYAKGVALVALMVVSACSAPPRSTSAAPAAGPTSPLLAGQLFGKICIATQPSFAQAPAALSTAGFTQNSITSTYYLTTENLSIKLLDSRTDQQGVLSFEQPANPDTCSIVFGTDLSADAAVAQFSQGTASVTTSLPPGITVTSRPQGNLTFINARTNVQ